MFNRRTMKARPHKTKGGKNWLVQWTEDGKTKKFQNKSKAVVDEFIREFKKKKAVLSEKGLRLMEQEDVAFSVYKALDFIEGKNYSIMEALEFFERHHDFAEKSITLEKAKEAYLESKKLANRSDQTIKEYRTRLQDFVVFFGKDKPLSSITVKGAEDWLKTKTSSVTTRNHFRRVGSALMNWGKVRGFTDINPFKAIPKAEVNTDSTDVFSLEQIKQMMDASDHVEVKLWVAIGAFAGIRPEEMNKLYWKHIHLNTDKIDLTAVAAKKNRRRIVEIQPRLKEILEKYKGSGKVFTPKEFGGSPYLKRMKDELEFEWIHDGLRHSFGSYHLAAG